MDMRSRRIRGHFVKLTVACELKLLGLLARLISQMLKF